MVAVTMPATMEVEIRVVVVDPELVVGWNELPPDFNLWGRWSGGWTHALRADVGREVAFLDCVWFVSNLAQFGLAL